MSPDKPFILGAPVEPPPRRLQNWLSGFAEYSSFTEAPANTLFWTGISTIAGALRRKVWIPMPHFTWVPNFYVVLVARPGIISKSTTANIGMNLLREVPGVKFGPEVITWQSLVQTMGESAEEFIDPTTGEFNTMSAMTICSDELGNLLNPHDREMVDIYISLWDGKQGKFEKKTKTSGNDAIVNPWINIITCTTPSWLSGNMPEYMIGGGFTSRCVFVYAEKKRQLLAWPDEAVKDYGQDKFLKLRSDLIHDLESISLMAGPMEISGEARKWGREWYERHWSTRHSHLDPEQFGGYLARKQTHMVKLAMVLSAAQGNSRIIDAPTLRCAYDLVTGLEADMNHVFARIGQNEITRLASQLVEILQRDGNMTQQKLYAQVFRHASYNEFLEAWQSCINAGHILCNTEGNVAHAILRPRSPAGSPQPAPDTAAAEESAPRHAGLYDFGA